jgi:hypothetical protein
VHLHTTIVLWAQALEGKTKAHIGHGVALDLVVEQRPSAQRTNHHKMDNVKAMPTLVLLGILSKE